MQAEFENTLPERVGLYVSLPVRERLNAFKSRVSVRLGRSVSQSDAIDLLLDAVAEPKINDRGGDGQSEQRLT